MIIKTSCTLATQPPEELWFALWAFWSTQPLAPFGQLGLAVALPGVSLSIFPGHCLFLAWWLSPLTMRQSHLGNGWDPTLSSGGQVW